MKRIVSEINIEGISAKLTITYTTEYGSHPYEWVIQHNEKIHYDPTSWSTHFSALKYGIEALEKILVKE